MVREETIAYRILDWGTRSWLSLSTSGAHSPSTCWPCMVLCLLAFKTRPCWCWEPRNTAGGLVQTEALLLSISAGCLLNKVQSRQACGSGLNRYPGFLAFDTKLGSLGSYQWRIMGSLCESQRPLILDLGWSRSWPTCHGLSIWVGRLSLISQAMTSPMCWLGFNWCFFGFLEKRERKHCPSQHKVDTPVLGRVSQRWMFASCTEDNQGPGSQVFFSSVH